MVDELSGSKGSRDIANLPYFSESVDLDLILAHASESGAGRLARCAREGSGLL